MPKAATKVVAKKETKAVAPKKVAKKIAKPTEPKKVKKSSVGKNYFTIQEDVTILESVKKGNERTKTEVAKELANKLVRPVEAVRDRIKRYLAKLSSADQQLLIKEAKRNPKQYAFFKKAADGTKKIEKIGTDQPILQNRDIKRKPRISKNKKPIKDTKKKPEADKLAWIAQKLQDKDQYFKLDFSVQLLTDIFNVLIEEEKVSIKAIEDLVTNTFCNLTLEQILEKLNVKRAN